MVASRTARRRSIHSNRTFFWRAEEIADTIREALKYIPAERLIITSDCDMGREGMSRRHARYKMVSLVLGTNIIRRELGLPEAECLAADGRYSLVRTV